MISFEFANGSPCGPHVPTMMDDDQYVEYRLDDLEGFPSDVDEEERMFMEAVMLSLKDLEMRGPQAEEQPPWDTPDSLNLSQKDDQPDDASTAEKRELLETESTSTSVGHLGSLKTEPISTSVSKSHDSRREDQTRTRVPSTEPASQTPLSIMDGSTGPSSQNDTSESTQGTSDSDLSANVMDGLIRRWDFNFSRNNHSR